MVATAAVALAALVVADVVTYTELRSFLYGQIDQALEMSHIPVESSISGRDAGPAPGSAGPRPNQLFCPEFEGMQVNTQGLGGGTVIEVRTRSNTTVYRCGLPMPGQTQVTYPALPKSITGFSASAADFGESTVYFTASALSGSSSFRVRASILREGPADGSELIVAVPLGSTAGTLHRLFLLEVSVTAAALLGALLLGLWLVHVSLRPLRRVEQTAGAIAGGNITERVPGDQARTEVGRLARALNVMLERIQGAFAQRDRTEAELRASEERMRRFVADASHELRTPLSAVSAYAELFGRGASRRPEDLARVMGGITGETARMGQLVDDLLLLARLDEGRPLERQQVELVELAAQSVETASTVAPSWPVRLEASAPVEVKGDRARLRQVLDNLLSNVRAHTPEGTRTAVEVSQWGGEAVVRVSDNGPGITDEQLSQVFERFFRADPSRSRSHGGAGLGLSIVASIVRAHGGEVDASHNDGGGATFTIRIPVSAPPEDPSEHMDKFTAGS